MKKARLAMQSRSHLDDRFKEIGPASCFAPPIRGWIRAIREALGMSSAQLAKRLGVRQPSAVALEQSEAKGTIELATLRRVAEALDCTLVYALVPNQPLEKMVQKRAEKAAAERITRVDHSMRLEHQGLSRGELQAQHKRLVADLLRGNPRRLWDEPT